MAFEPKNLAELLEWRNLLPGWKYRLRSEYLEELRRLCAEGRVEAFGRPVRFRRDGEQLSLQLVPPKAFDDGQLLKEVNTYHGELRLKGVPRWTDLRFARDANRAWQAALDADEIRAPHASSPLPEATQPTPTAPAEAPAPAPIEPPAPPGPKPGNKTALKALIIPIASEILNAPDRPPHKRGWKAELARRASLVLRAKGLSYEFSSIERELHQNRDKVVHPDAEVKTAPPKQEMS